jgi:Zn-dependent peptidase ImmA (M78 family)
MCPEAAAVDILTRTGQIGNAPVSLTGICEYLGIRIRLGDMGEMCGCSLVVAGEKMVYVAKRMPLNRKRFTLAHEIGHISLGHYGFRFCHRSVGDARIEREANQFAGHLLLPRETFTQRVSCGMSPEVLATTYRVSLDVVDIQIRQLHLA